MIRNGVGIIGHIIDSGVADFVNDTTADDRGVQIEGTTTAPLERLMVAPLLVGNDVKGVLAVWRIAGTPFDSDDLQFLVGLARQAAIAIENARLFSAAEQRAAELDTVNTVSQQVAGKLDVGALIELVGEQIRSLFDADIAYVALRRPRRGADQVPVRVRRIGRSAPDGIGSDQQGPRVRASRW